MWKKLHRRLSYSKKHPSLSDNAFRVWTHMLPHADTYGRFSADPVLVKSQCMPRYDLRLEQVEAALQELVREKLIHLYDCGGDRLLVFHDHSEWNPTGALANAKPDWPAPSMNLCTCLRKEEIKPTTPFPRRSNGASDLILSDLSEEETPKQEKKDLRKEGEGCGEGQTDLQKHGALTEGSDGHLYVVASKTTKIACTDGTLRRYISSWSARIGPERLLKLLYSPEALGRDVLEVNKLVSAIADKPPSASEFMDGKKPVAQVESYLNKHQKSSETSMTTDKGGRVFVRENGGDWKYSKSETQSRQEYYRKAATS